jgi:hypothetical protein
MKVPRPLEVVAIVTQGQINVNHQNASSFIFIQNQSEETLSRNGFL